MRPCRAIPIDGKDFVYGWYLKTHNPTGDDTHWIIKDGLYATDIIIGIDNNNFPKMLQGCYPVIPETVGQQVGLKDKNGKDIYEGDKTIDDTFGKCEVKWLRGEFYLWQHEKMTSISITLAEDMEIIGNIHQEQA